MKTLNGRQPVSRRVLLRIAGWLAGAGALLGLTAPQARATAASQAGQVLDGTWLIVRTRPDGSPSPAGLNTYHPDGTYTSTNDNPAQTTGHGAWVRAGDREFAITLRRFLFEDDRNLMQKVQGRHRLNERLDEITTQVHVEVFDLDDNLVRSFDVTGRATPIRVEM